MQGVRPEIERIHYLLQRDGEEATRTWVERTLRIYREAVTKLGSHASNTTYRPLFEKAIHEFEEWLATQGRVMLSKPTPIESNSIGRN